MTSHGWPSPQSYRTLPTGFSLPEILVSLGLAGLLATLGLTALAAARDAAGGAKCIAKLRTLSQSVLLFAVDNNQTLPSQGAPTYGDIRGIWFSYQDLVMPYLDQDLSKKQQIFACRYDKEFYPKFPSYVFNGANEYQPGFKGVADARLASIAQPSKTLLLTEGSMMFSKSWHWPKTKQAGDVLTYAAFVDGHARLVAFCPSLTLLNAGVNPPPPYDYLFGD
ncbi:MAG: hypothetical protein BGO12_08880 [Verrucomicrobia bacterium 61-8]|nr:prepilin-type N-terminal cleavage/methylation domain-containing protein [Verrucomicrobiota bacterium]OJV26376.1 MAG: hypothetical protein BGO12_08880 [Verrucomicrobia bacterium 61-8]